MDPKGVNYSWRFVIIIMALVVILGSCATIAQGAELEAATGPQFSFVSVGSLASVSLPCNLGGMVMVNISLTQLTERAALINDQWQALGSEIRVPTCDYPFTGIAVGRIFGLDVTGQRMLVFWY